MGKGGTGKSTSSALTALHLAQKGYKTWLVSMDPAHNQGDIFEKKLSDKFFKIADKLWVKEVDVGRWVEKYLETIQMQVKRTYSYLTAFNLEQYLDILKLSPGIEEYALLMAYRDVRKASAEVDYIVFDMPPTALTLKFLTLPDVSLQWLENLLILRNKIIEKKEIVTRVKFGKKEIDTDKIRSKLKQQIEEYTAIKGVFADKSKTVLNLVMNPDRLSFSESQLIVDKLDKYGIPVSNLYLNKWKEGFDDNRIKVNFKQCGYQLLPESKTPLLGIKSLTDYLQRVNRFIEF